MAITTHTNMLSYNDKFKLGYLRFTIFKSFLFVNRQSHFVN